MKTLNILSITLLLASCGAVQKGIDQMKQIDEEAAKQQAAEDAQKEKDNTVTGSRTKTVSTTTTISKSGDQSVFEDDTSGDDDASGSESPGSKPTPIPATFTLVGTWASDCNQGMAYMQVFTAPTQKQAGMEIMTTNVYDANCEYLQQSFVQKIVYAPASFVFIDANTMQNQGVTFRRVGG